MAFVALSASAQFTDSGTGLLQCPSAEMNHSGTFSITNNYLNYHTLSTRWGYDTFSYGIGITFFSWIEINYVCTIFDDKRRPTVYDARDKIRFNQDRHLSAKVLLLGENSFNQKWIPSIAIGVRDIDSGMFSAHFDAQEHENGYFTALYIMACKHINSSIGDIACHFGYQYNRRTDYRLNAPCAAITWYPVWLRNRWFDPKFILEFDARTPNIGFIADIWDSRFQAMFELQNFQWVSFGLRFKLELKGAE